MIRIEFNRLLRFWIAVAATATGSSAFAIDTESTGYKILAGQTLTLDPSHSTACHFVTNNSAFAQFVSTKTPTEWYSFLSAPPANFSVVSCVPCTPGSQTYSTPGTYTFQVPPGCSSVTARVWGGGGGGGGDSGGSQTSGGAGGTSSFAGTLIATGGGGGGSAGAGGAGGAAGAPSGGTFQYSGLAGASSDSGSYSAAGAHSPPLYAAGVGGAGVMSGSGNPGGAPGAGASGGIAGGGHTGGGGGSGAFAQKTFTFASLQNVSIVVGAGGTAGSGNSAGAMGGDGKVIVDYGGAGFDHCGEVAAVGIGAFCGTDEGATYIGSFNGGRYMVTHGGCNNSPTPTCDGFDDPGSSWPYAANDGRLPSPAGTLTGLNSTTDGSGNTAALAANYGDTDAAKWCADMTHAGYSDWFLPAKDELNFLWSNKSMIPGWGRNANSYISSTEASATHIWEQDNGTGAQSSTWPKTSTVYHFVRCARRF